jgi:predicted DNA-binding transcriptional regulator AlpA
MSVQRIYRRREVQKLYGDQPDSSFYYRIKTGDIPKPDVMLGPDTPGWTEDLIKRDQQCKIERGTSR